MKRKKKQEKSLLRAAAAAACNFSPTHHFISDWIRRADFLKKMALLRTFPILLLHLGLLSWSAWGRLNLAMHDTIEAYLGDTAHIPCQYNFTEEPTFVMIQWYVRNVSDYSRERIFYGDNTEHILVNNTDCSGRVEVISENWGSRLIIRDIQLRDDRHFYCQVNGLTAGHAEDRTRLKVFAPPEAPVIEGVLTGISVTNEMPSKVASCEARNGYPKPNITWYRNSTPLVPEPGHVNMLTLVTKSNGFYSVQSTLEYKVIKEDMDANFSCEVSFFVPGAIRRVESSNVNIPVHYPTTMVEMWNESPQGLVKEGDSVELRCQGDGNPPLTFIFNREQEPDVALETNHTDVLILSPVTRKDSGVYQCRPQETDGHSEVKGEMHLTVHYLDPAVVVPKDSEVMLKGEDLTATCNALSSLKTSTVWYKNGGMVGKGNTLHLKDVTYETTGGYVCEVTVPSLPVLHTNGYVHIIVQGGPQLLGTEQKLQLEEVIGRTKNLTCKAQGYPLPSISWNIIGSQDWHEVVNKAYDDMAYSVVSVTITSDVSVQCNASNEVGAEAKTFSIKAIPRVTPAAPFPPGEGSGAIIVAIILCLLLLAILGSVFYFLYKKGYLCGRSRKQEITNEKTTKDDIVLEMRNNAKNEEAILLKARQLNGEKKTSDQ